MRQLVQQEVLLVSGAGSCGSHKPAKKSCSKPKTGCSSTPTPPVTPPVTPPAIN